MEEIKREPNGSESESCTEEFVQVVRRKSSRKPKPIAPVTTDANNCASDSSSVEVEKRKKRKKKQKRARRTDTDAADVETDAAEATTAESTEAASKKPKTGVSPAEILSMPPTVMPPPATAAPRAFVGTARRVNEQCTELAAEITADITSYLLTEGHKVGKHHAKILLRKVQALNQVITKLALHNNYLAGMLQNSKGQLHEPSDPIKTTAPIETAPLPRISYAGAAKRLLQPQHSAAPTVPQPVAPAPRDRPVPKPRVATEAIIAASRLAPPRHQIVVKPTDLTNADSAKTKAQVFKTVDFRTAKIGIKSVRPIKDGGVLIETASAKDLQTFMQNRQMQKAGLSVSQPRTELPRVIVRDIPKELEAADIAEHIRAQNIPQSPSLDNAVLRPLFKVGRKDKEGNDWVVEMNNSIRELLLPRSKIFVSYMHCRIADYLVATRCYKCQKYGHVDKYCKSKDPVCAFCAKPGHSNKECPNKEKAPSCANCRARQLPHNHSAGNKNCPSRSSALMEKAARVLYK